MIDAPFLASLRRQHRAELVLVLVQLEQLCSGTWDCLSDLAEQLGTDRATLNRSLSQLDRLGLIRRCSRGNSGGTWLWWVKRHAADVPAADAEPAWVIAHLAVKTSRRIPLSDRWSWADRHGIPRNTMRSFLAGHHRILRGEWRLVSSPLDQLEVAA